MADRETAARETSAREKESSANARKQLASDAKDKQAREKQIEAMKGTPTPTQEECDLLKLGEHPELAKDGSMEDPNVGFGVHRNMAADHENRGGYATRQSTASTHSGGGGQHNPQHGHTSAKA
jgi:hypothetical protein